MTEAMSELFGSPAGANIKVSLSPKAHQAARDVKVWRDSTEPEDDDVATTATLAALYERAGAAGATVICGIV